MIDLTLDSDDDSEEEDATTSSIEKTFSSDRCVCVRARTRCVYVV